jgi:hypothetical protein
LTGWLINGKDFRGYVAPSYIIYCGAGDPHAVTQFAGRTIILLALLQTRCFTKRTDALIYDPVQKIIKHLHDCKRFLTERYCDLVSQVMELEEAMR